MVSEEEKILRIKRLAIKPEDQCCYNKNLIVSSSLCKHSYSLVFPANSTSQSVHMWRVASGAHSAPTATTVFTTNLCYSLHPFKRSQKMFSLLFVFNSLFSLFSLIRSYLFCFCIRFKSVLLYGDLIFAFNHS